MEDLSLLGNAAAVPIIIGITQILKRNFNFKRKAEVMSLFVSFGVCVGWELYYTPEQELITAWTGGIISTGKHLIHLVIVSCATWLSASKAYDFILGEKKAKSKIQEHIAEKEDLKWQMAEMKNSSDVVEEPTEEEVVEEDVDNTETTELDKKVRDILDRE